MTSGLSTMTPPATIPGRPARVITVGSVLIGLFLVSLWDGVGLLAYRMTGIGDVPSPTWMVLNAYPGSLAVGVTYLALAFGLAFAAGFDARPLLLVWAVTFGAWMYAMVTVSFLLSWLLTWPEIVVTDASKPAVLCLLHALVRRALIPPRPAPNPGA